MSKDMQSAIAIISLIASILFAFTTVVCAAGSDGPKQRKASIAWASLFFAFYGVVLWVASHP